MRFVMNVFVFAVVAGWLAYGQPVRAVSATPEASPTASPVVQVMTSASIGEYLATGEGMTLYVFALDKAGSGTSACNGDCAAKWIPFVAPSVPALPEGVGGAFSLIPREDGSQQVAYDGKPLYTYVLDTQPGETMGHLVGSSWTNCTCHDAHTNAQMAEASAQWKVARPVTEGA